MLCLPAFGVVMFVKLHFVVVGFILFVYLSYFIIYFSLLLFIVIILFSFLRDEVLKRKKNGEGEEDFRF